MSIFADPNGGTRSPVYYPWLQYQRIDIFAQREGTHQGQRRRLPLGQGQDRRVL